MLNSLNAEIYKLKKNKIYYVCTFIVVLASCWLIYKDIIASTPPDCVEWAKSALVVITLFLSIASGFIVTFLMQREYEDKTIINVLCAPTPRTAYVLSKLAIWFIWYIVVLDLCMVVFIIGGKIVFTDVFETNEIKMLFNMIVPTRLLSFVASWPLLLIAVIQKKTFYPTIMCSLAFTGFEIFSMILPIKYSCLIPWSAAMLYGFGVTGSTLTISLISVIITGAIGLGGAMILFKKQNQ